MNADKPINVQDNGHSINMQDITDSEALGYVSRLLNQLVDIHEARRRNETSELSRCPSYECIFELQKEVVEHLVPKIGIKEPAEGHCEIESDDDTRYKDAEELYKRFWLKEPPPISISDYLNRFHRYCRSSAATYLTAGCLIYLVSVEKKSIPVTQRNVYRLFSAAFVISAKFIEDELYSMSRYATTAGLKKPELSRLELSFLLLIDFEVKADREILKRGLRNWANITENDVV